MYAFPVVLEAFWRAPEEFEDEQVQTHLKQRAGRVKISLGNLEPGRWEQIP